MGGFVASDPSFSGQPGVINGASEVLGEIFGDAGRHVRAAVGVAVLPLDSPVEVEVTLHPGLTLFPEVVERPSTGSGTATREQRDERRSPSGDRVSSRSPSASSLNDPGKRVSPGNGWPREAGVPGERATPGSGYPRGTGDPGKRVSPGNG